MTDSKGAWIFLSHSTKDWHEIRLIRNLLEERGHRPLAFFLKCLTDHSELDDLIKREIIARTWFLLCDSENARNSSWVQAENAYIEKLPEKCHEQINLGDSVESQIERIDRLLRRATIFLSYALDDTSHAYRIRDALTKSDYSVWVDNDVDPGGDWMQQISSALDQAVHRGFVLVLLSRNSLQSQFVMSEIQYALEKSVKAAHGANIIPIMLDDPRAIQASMPQQLQLHLKGIQWLDFSQGDFETNISKLVADLKRRPMD